MISVGEEIKKILQFDMISSLIKADTKLIDKKHSGKFISNLTYDVSHITNLLSDAILVFSKDSLTLIGLLICYVLSKLEAFSNINNYDTFDKYSCKISWQNEWGK